jgi:hypothetical protein
MIVISLDRKIFSALTIAYYAWHLAFVHEHNQSGCLTGNKNFRAFGDAGSSGFNPNNGPNSLLTLTELGTSTQVWAQWVNLANKNKSVPECTARLRFYDAAAAS